MSLLVSRTDSQFIYSFSKSLFTDVRRGLKLVEEVEDIPEGYKPVHFASYLRTDKDNLVLVNQNAGSYLSLDESALPDFTLASDLVENYPNILVDLSMLTCKTLLDSAFSFSSKDRLQEFVMNSQCFPVGAVESDLSFYVVSNIVINSDILTRFSDPSESFLNHGYCFKPIETLRAKGSLEKAVSKSLIIVSDRGGENNE